MSKKKEILTATFDKGKTERIYQNKTNKKTEIVTVLGLMCLEEYFRKTIEIE